MASTTFTVHTSLSPNEVMALMTDFGPSRVANWPNIDEAHFEDITRSLLATLAASEP